MDVGSLVGCMLISVIIAAALWGVTVIQTWYYYAHYPSDPWTIRLLVFVVFIVDTIHQALISHMLYTYTITDFGSFEALERVVWSLVIEVYFNGLTSLLVQCFMTWRIFRLSNRNWLAAGSAMVWVIAEFALSVAYGIKGIKIPTFAELPEIKGISMSINGVAAAGDLYIALFLVYLLRRSRTGFRRSDSMISKLIVFTINTGILTSICALATLVAYALSPHTMIYGTFYYLIGRLYSNSLLATLNARREMRGGDDDDGRSLSLQSHCAHKSNLSMPGKPSKYTRNSISVKIDTTKECVRDEYPTPNSDVKILEADSV